MIYLTYAPIEQEKRWTVKSGTTAIAEVKIDSAGRCTLRSDGELCVDTLDAITAFMREGKLQLA